MGKGRGGGEKRGGALSHDLSFEGRERVGQVCYTILLLGKEEGKKKKKEVTPPISATEKGGAPFTALSIFFSRGRREKRKRGEMAPAYQLPLIGRGGR